MNRSVFSSDEVADIVFKIVGEIEPVGETNTDNARFSHLQTLLNTLDILIDEVTFVLPCENRYEYSMQRAGQEVRNWVKDKSQQFANLGEDEEPEHWIDEVKKWLDPDIDNELALERIRSIVYGMGAEE